MLLTEKHDSVSRVNKSLGNLGKYQARSGIAVNEQDFIPIRWPPFIDSHGAIEGTHIASTWKGVGRVREPIGLCGGKEGYQCRSGR